MFKQLECIQEESYSNVNGGYGDYDNSNNTTTTTTSAQEQKKAKIIIKPINYNRQNINNIDDERQRQIDDADDYFANNLLYNISFIMDENNIIDELCNESDAFSQCLDNYNFNSTINLKENFDIFILKKYENSFNVFLHFIKNPEQKEFFRPFIYLNNLNNCTHRNGHRHGRNGRNGHSRNGHGRGLNGHGISQSIMKVVEYFIFAENFSCNEFTKICGNYLLKNIQLNMIKTVYEQIHINVLHYFRVNNSSNGGGGGGNGSGSCSCSDSDSDSEIFESISEKYINKLCDLDFAKNIIKKFSLFHSIDSSSSSSILKCHFPYTNKIYESFEFSVNKPIQIWAIGIYGMVPETVIADEHDMYVDAIDIINEFSVELTILKVSDFIGTIATIENNFICRKPYNKPYELHLNEPFNVQPFSNYVIQLKLHGGDSQQQQQQYQYHHQQSTTFYCQSLLGLRAIQQIMPTTDGIEFIINFEGLPCNLPFIYYRTYPHLMSYPYRNLKDLNVIYF